MELSNINLWFAKDENSEIITIDKSNKNNKYICPICGGEVIPKALNSDFVSPHFAHINREDCGGEKFIHWWTKNNLLKEGDVFSAFTTEEKQYLCKNIEVEKCYNTPYGIYRPDVTIECYNGEIIFLEIGVTSIKKRVDYIDKWTYLGNEVIEFNMKNIYDSETFDVAINNRFQAIYYDGVKIYNNDKNYDSFKNKILSMDKYKDQIKDLEWFIDDIYAYKLSKDEYRLDGLINEIGYIKSDYTFEHSLLVTDILKSKCSSVMKDIIGRKDKCFYKIIEDKLKSLDCEYEIECEEKFEEARLVWDRLHGDATYILKIYLNNNPDTYDFLNFYDCTDRINAFNGRLYKRYRIMTDRCDKLIEEVSTIDNDIYSIQENINKYEKIYINIHENNLYPVNSIYKENIKTHIKTELELLANEYNVRSYESNLDSFLDVELFNDRFKTDDVDGEIYVNIKYEFNEKIIRDIKKSFYENIAKILKLKEIEHELKEKCTNVKRIEIIDGEVRIEINSSTELRIDDVGVVRVNDTINLINLGEDYLDNIEKSVEALSLLLDDSITSGYTKEQILNIKKLKNIYECEINAKFKVTVSKDNLLIKTRWGKVVSVTSINKQWDKLIKEVSDDVRKYIYK